MHTGHKPKMGKNEVVNCAQHHAHLAHSGDMSRVPLLGRLRPVRQSPPRAAPRRDSSSRSCSRMARPWQAGRPLIRPRPEQGPPRVSLLPPRCHPHRQRRHWRMSMDPAGWRRIPGQGENWVQRARWPLDDFSALVHLLARSTAGRDGMRGRALGARLPFLASRQTWHP